MSPIEKNEDTLGELDWLAFRYVAGELSESEAKAFELRLDEEQAAREAVTDAVEIVQTVTAAEHLEEIPMVATAARQASHWRHVAWTAITAMVAACCGSVALLYWSAQQDDWAQPAQAAVEDVKPAAPGVASAWLESLDQPVLVTTETILGESLDIETALPLETEMAAPDWMAAALAGMADETGMGGMDMGGMDMERGDFLPLEN